MTLQKLPAWHGSSPDFAELLLRIAQREEAAMAELHQASLRTIQVYVRRFIDDCWDAEEVMQDVYRHIWLYASAYNPDRGTPCAWFYTITRSRAVDSIRSRKNRALDSRLVDDGYFVFTGNPEACHGEKWRQRLVNRIVSGLPAVQRDIIDLAFFEGRSHSEIAEMRGLPVGTVKSRIRKAMASIRQSLPFDSNAVW